MAEALSTPDIPILRLRNQRIAGSRPSRPADAVAILGAVQAQDYLGSLWAIGLRTSRAAEADVERAIAAGRIVRTWLMRGTLHLVHPADLRWMLGLLAPRVVAASAGRFRALGLDGRTVSRARKLLAAAMEGGRELLRRDAYRVLDDGGVPTGGQCGIHLLQRLALDGLICFGPRQGKEQTFVLLDEWVPPSPAVERDEALGRLAARYFASRGPATLDDLAWWSGLTIADCRVAAAAASEQLARVAGPDDREHWTGADPPSGRNRPRFVLLPPFDEFLVGYRDRTAILDPPHVKRVNAGGGMLDAVIVRDGHVVGTWKRTLAARSVRITARLFTRLADSDEPELRKAVDRYARFLGRPAESRIETL